MLETFRKSKKIIIGTVVGAFILWGAFSVGTQFQGPGRHAGKVFGKKITFQEYDRFYRAGQIFSFSGNDIKDPEVLRQAAWQGIIFSREAKRRKIDVADAEVRQQILKLLEDQKIDPEQYEAWIERALRQTPKQFEDQVREVIRIQKLFAALSESAPTDVTVEEAKKIYFQQNDQVSADMIRFPKKEDADAFREKLKTPEDWKTEKKKTPDSFKAMDDMPAEVMPMILQINPADGVKLQALEKDHFSEVIPSGKEFKEFFSVFLITNRKKGDEKGFEAAKNETIEMIKNRKKQALLMEKTREITEQAQLTDYLAPESATPSPSPSV